MRVPEEHEASDNGHEGKRRCPRLVPDPPQSTEQFNASHPQRENPLDLMLQNLVVASRKGLRESERPDGPGFMIAPDHDEQAGE